MSKSLSISPTNFDIASYSNESFDTISVQNAQYPLQSTSNIFSEMFRILSKGGKIILENNLNNDEKFGFMMNGFLVLNDKEVQKPNTDIQLGTKMNLKDKKVEITTGKWTVDPVDEDMIDEDELLEDEDFERPQIPQVDCSDKKKACKNCSCGRAEREQEEEKLSREAKMELIRKGVVTGCGSCGLGDAFRCDSCPFLGMPKFVPGQAGGISLELSDDI